MKASAGIVLDDDVDEDDEDELLADVDTEAEVPILDEDLDAIIDSGTPAMPSNMGGGFSDAACFFCVGCGRYRSGCINKLSTACAWYMVSFVCQQVKKNY